MDSLSLYNCVCWFSRKCTPEVLVSQGSRDHLFVVGLSKWPVAMYKSAGISVTSSQSSQGLECDFLGRRGGMPAAKPSRLLSLCLLYSHPILRPFFTYGSPGRAGITVVLISSSFFCFSLGRKLFPDALCLHGLAGGFSTFLCEQRGLR